MKHLKTIEEIKTALKEVKQGKVKPILKLFENKGWTDQKFRDAIEDKLYLTDAFEKYINWKTNDDGIIVYDYFFTTKSHLPVYKIGTFMINFDSDDSGQCSYDVGEDIEELVAFINNPELFINSKKYNL